jgi:hypothetical protein
VVEAKKDRACLFVKQETKEIPKFEPELVGWLGSVNERGTELLG